MQPSYIKNKAIKLRGQGFSYNIISKKIGISKSTLSNWLKEVPFSPNKIVLKRIETGPLKSGRISHNKRVRNITEIKKLAKNELGKLSHRDLWMIGLGLYLGEGSKIYESIKIINSDPKIVKLSIKWFKDILKLKNENITIAIHLYPDNNINKCLNFWSKLLNIPLKQFRKTQIDRRLNKSNKKKRKLPYGTAHITAVSNNNQEFGVKLHRRIMGWIDSILEQV